MIRKFLTDSGFNFAAQIVVLLCGTAASIIKARVLGVSDFGLAAFVLLLPMTIQALVGSGLAPTVVYMVASEKWATKDVIPRLLGIWFYLSTLMIVVGTVSVFAGSSFFGDVSVNLLLASLLLIPTDLLGAAWTSILTANRRFRSLLWHSVIVWPAKLANLAVFVWWLRLGVPGVLMASIVSSIFSLLVGMRLAVYYDKSAKPRLLPELRFRQLAPSLSYGLRAGMGNIVGFLNYRSDQFIIQALLGSAGLGLYSVAVGLAEKLWILANNLGTVLLPLASSDQSRSGRIERFVGKVAVIVFCMMLLFSAAMILLARPFVSFLYGAKFVESASVVVLLLPGIALGGPSKLLANYVAGQGRPELNAMRGVVALVLNITLNLLLIPTWGIGGAAVATSVSYSMSAMANVVIFHRMSRCSLSRLFVPTKAELRQVIGRVRLLMTDIKT